MKRVRFAAGIALAACFAAGLAAVHPARAACFPKAAIPMLPETAATPQGFVVPGWQVQEQGSQDLNGDGIPDLVMVLHGTDAKNIVTVPANDACSGVVDAPPVDTNPYLLVVAFANPGGKGYHRVLQNADFIPRAAPGDSDPRFSRITVRRGSFAVELNSLGTSNINRQYTFRFQHNRFELIGYDEDSVWRSRGEVDDTSANLSTGRVKHSTGSISDDRLKDSWTTLKAPKTPSIEEIGEADSYTLPE
jgi:hypothetical protein